ncbi:MAG: VCBS repeat-containing protein, partial [Chitinophagia bacterium]|nr:VCBS repeat-containing protein [Chitinophagia bacterium]
MTDTVNLKNPVAFNLGVYPVGIAAGDFDGDGKTDLVATNSDPNNIYIFRNTSSIGTIDAGTLARPLILSTLTAPYYVKVADLDGDGKLDIIIGSGSSSVSKISIFRNISTSGTFSFATRVDLSSGGNAPVDLAVNDIDRDGKPDIVVVNQYSSRISILKNNGTPGSITTTSFGAPVSFTTGTFPFRICTGDFDRDGKTDIAVSNFGSNTLSVFRNNSSGGVINTSSLNTPLTLATGGGPSGIAATDIDGDGKSELLALSSSVNTLTVYGNTSASGSLSFTSGTDFSTSSIPAEITL